MMWTMWTCGQTAFNYLKINKIDLSTSLRVFVHIKSMWTLFCFCLGKVKQKSVHMVAKCPHVDSTMWTS